MYSRAESGRSSCLQNGQMTDLLNVLPSFPTAQYTHLLPSLEKNLITTSDLLTLDGIEVAKRAQLPLLDVKRLIAQVLATLQAELGVQGDHKGGYTAKKFEDVPLKGEAGWGKLRTDGNALLNKLWKTISIGDERLDELLGGGIPTCYITEFVGERSAVRSSINLSLLLTLPLAVVQQRPSSSFSSSCSPSFHRLMVSDEQLSTSPPSMPSPPLASLNSSAPTLSSPRSPRPSARLCRESSASQLPTSSLRTTSSSISSRSP